LIDSQLPAATIAAAVAPDSAISVHTLLTLTISRLNSNPPSSAVVASRHHHLLLTPLGRHCPFFPTKPSRPLMHSSPKPPTSTITSPLGTTSLSFYCCFFSLPSTPSPFFFFFFFFCYLPLPSQQTHRKKSFPSLSPKDKEQGDKQTKQKTPSKQTNKQTPELLFYNNLTTTHKKPPPPTNTEKNNQQQQHQ
jgi:hypothetical protein